MKEESVSVNKMSREFLIQEKNNEGEWERRETAEIPSTSFD